MSLEAAFEIGRLYEPINRIADSIEPLQREPFVNLPGLRGYWPMSAVDFLGNAKDHSAASSDLARTGSPTFGHDGNPFIQTGSGNNFLAGSISAQSITGTETWIDPALRGLTFGCWVYVDSSPASQGGLVSRWDGGIQKSYTLLWGSGNVVTFLISPDGTTNFSVVSGVLPILTPHFVAARFTPSSELAVFVDGVKTVNTTSIPAGAFVGTPTFEVGRVNANPAQVLAAKIRDVFLCATALSDSLIEQVRTASLP